MRRADQSYRGVLPTVVRRCVWSRNIKNEEALAHWGLLRQKKEKKENYLVYNKQDIVTQIPELNTDIDAEPQKKKYIQRCA